jgi:hypothetical protein
MAKVVRAARHYQDRDHPVRRIADAGVAGIKRAVKQALMHLGTLVPDTALQHARAGDWHGLKREIAWGHFREVLKGAFARIGKVREEGAQLGARKINGVFAAKRRAVRFRKEGVVIDLLKYSPDQPRDEHGRWTGGGGGETSSQSVHVGGRTVTVELSPTSRALGQQLVEVNVARFDEAWSRDKNFYVGHGGKVSGQVGGEVSGRYGRFQEYLASHDSMQASDVGIQADGRVGFDNGRHRFAVLRDSGVARMPVAMDKESIANGIKYGYVDKISKANNLVQSRPADPNPAIVSPALLNHTDPYRAETVVKDIGGRFNFDLYDQKTQDRIRQAQDDDLIAELEQQARDSIDSIILAGAQSGLGPDEIVEDIRSLIGLTDRQSQAVMNYQNMLYDLDPDALVRRLRNTAYDEEVQAAIDAGEDLTDVAISSMVADYAENYLDFRAQMIAETESTRAVNAGLQDAYAQAIDRGALTSDSVKQFWQVALDEKTCEVCLSIPDMNPDGIGIDDSFESIDGQMDAPPDPHPSCRCSLEIVTDLDKVPDEE